MYFYLLKMRTSGVKSLENPIELSFYEKTLKKQFDATKYNATAIYGANGAGKTAFIYAAEIYKQFVLNHNYLAIHNGNGSLENLLNQKTKDFYIKMTFAVLSNDYELLNVYEHEILISNINGYYKLAKETLKKLQGYRLNAEDKYKVIYNVVDGELNSYANKSEFADISNISKNLLWEKSLTSIVLSSPVIAQNFKENSYEEIMTICSFAQSIVVCLQNSDTNFINTANILNQYKTIRKYHSELDSDRFALLLLNNKLLSSDDVIVNKNFYKTFEKEINNLCKFIRVFKSNLVNIEIDKEEKAEDYVCQIYFVYSDGRKISRKYESTGIKKFMQIYYALCNVERGGISFIDEFDANIHDVVLIKIVEYIKLYAKGQIVFTTHNLGLMGVLKNFKDSIVFISEDSEVSKWVQIGHNSAENVYRKGLIKNCPFNIEAFSFLGVFGSEDEKK